MLLTEFRMDTSQLESLSMFLKIRSVNSLFSKVKFVFKILYREVEVRINFNLNMPVSHK
jgi:hypothetical protein